MTTKELLIHLLLATLAGLLIGIEWQTRSKSAGLRTHAIVSLGATLMIIVRSPDFNVICDLTTAAGIWTTAGVGRI